MEHRQEKQKTVQKKCDKRKDQAVSIFLLEQIWFIFALLQTRETKTAFGIGRGEWRGLMYLQWNRIPKIYEKSVDACGIKRRCFAGFASRNLRTNPPPSTLSERQRVQCEWRFHKRSKVEQQNASRLLFIPQVPRLFVKIWKQFHCKCMNPCHRVGLFLVRQPHNFSNTLQKI